MLAVFSQVFHPEMLIVHCFTAVMVVVVLLTMVVCSLCHCGLSVYFAIFEAFSSSHYHKMASAIIRMQGANLLDVKQQYVLCCIHLRITSAVL